MTVLVFLAELVILTCTPQLESSRLEACRLEARPQWFQTWELCDRARTEGIENGTWIANGKIARLDPGVRIRLDCRPGRDIVMPEDEEDDDR